MGGSNSVNNSKAEKESDKMEHSAAVETTPQATAEVPTSEPVEPVKLEFKPIHSAIRWNTKSIEEIEDILSPPGAVDVIDDSNGNAPIHIASQNGHLNLVNILIRKKVKINAQNMKGNTAIHMAIGYDYYDVAMTLINAGADPELKNESDIPARLGLEGDSCLGTAALLGAKTTEDLMKAMDLCEERFEELNKLKFAQSGLKVKKALKDEWTTEVNERFKSITTKLP